jgi:hypothetical protein
MSIHHDHEFMSIPNKALCFPIHPDCETSWLKVSVKLSIDITTLRTHYKPELAVTSNCGSLHNPSFLASLPIQPSWNYRSETPNGRSFQALFLLTVTEGPRRPLFLSRVFLWLYTVFSLIVIVFPDDFRGNQSKLRDICRETRRGFFYRQNSQNISDIIQTGLKRNHWMMGCALVIQSFFVSDCKRQCGK